MFYDELGFLTSQSELGCESQAWGLSSRISWTTEGRNVSSEGECEKLDFFFFSFVSSFLFRVFSPLTLWPSYLHVQFSASWVRIALLVSNSLGWRCLKGLYLYMGNNSETVSLAHHTRLLGHCAVLCLQPSVPLCCLASESLRSVWKIWKHD